VITIGLHLRYILKDKDMLPTGKMEEPFVSLPSYHDLLTWSKDNEITRNQVNRQVEKWKSFQLIFDYITDNKLDGDYYEFGVHKARTFRMALVEARYQNMNDMEFYAFDSFEGLPHAAGDHIDTWSQGALATSKSKFKEYIKTSGFPLDGIHLIEGYYDQSLTNDLLNKIIKRRRPVFITIDCDLYDSAVPVFKFIENTLTKGCVIYIDDWFGGYKGDPTKGVAGAFNEYKQQSKWKFQEHLSIGWFGKSFIAY